MSVLTKALTEIRGVRDRARSVIRESDNLDQLTTANAVEVTADAALIALQRFVNATGGGELPAPNCCIIREED